MIKKYVPVHHALEQTTENEWVEKFSGAPVELDEDDASDRNDQFEATGVAYKPYVAPTAPAAENEQKAETGVTGQPEKAFHEHTITSSDGENELFKGFAVGDIVRVFDDNMTQLMGHLPEQTHDLP